MATDAPGVPDPIENNFLIPTLNQQGARRKGHEKTNRERVRHSTLRFSKLIFHDPEGDLFALYQLEELFESGPALRNFRP